MFERLKGYVRRRRGNAEIVGATMASLASAARAPALYGPLGVADTVWGRFEMMALHVFLYQHRAREGGSVLRDLAQEVVDAYFKELDHSLRELGIGDASMPKRMKKLGRMVYGRWSAYDRPVNEDDRAALAAAFERNVYAEGGDATAAADLADYALRARDALRGQAEADLLRGRLSFPAPLATAEAA